MRVAFLVVLVAGVASAEPRVAIGPIAGDKGHKVAKALSKAICAQVSCVPAGKAVTAKRVDWAKVKKLKIDAVVTGKVAGKKLSLTGTLTERRTSPVSQKTFTLTKGRVSPDDINAFSGEVVDAVGTRAASPAPVEPDATPATPPTEAAPEVPPPPAAEMAPAPSPSAPAPSSSPPEVTATAETTPSSAHHNQAPLVIGELGALLGGRSFSYDSLTQGTLLAYNAPFAVMPRAAVELYPLAHFWDDSHEGLGLTAEYALAVGLTSQLSGGLSHPTSMTRLDGGLLWWFYFGSLALAPEVGYRLLSFSTGNDKNGAPLTGLPNISYGAARISAAMRWALNDTFTLDVRLNAMPLLGAADLISASYFPKGSGLAFGGDAGVKIRIINHLSLGLLGEYMRYGFSFQSQSTDTYIAKGASDGYYALRASAVLDF